MRPSVRVIVLVSLPVVTESEYKVFLFDRSFQNTFFCRHKFHVRHSPNHNMKNLLPPAMPMQDFTSYQNPHLILQPQTLPTDLPPIYQPQHRASI